MSMHILISLQNVQRPSGDIGTKAIACGCFSSSRDAFEEKWKLDSYVDRCYPDQGYRSAVVEIVGDDAGPDNELEIPESIQLFHHGHRL